MSIFTWILSKFRKENVRMLNASDEEQKQENLEQKLSELGINIKDYNFMQRRELEKIDKIGKLELCVKNDILYELLSGKINIELIKNIDEKDLNELHCNKDTIRKLLIYISPEKFKEIKDSKQLADLEDSLNLGNEIFNNRQIFFENIDFLFDIIKNGKNGEILKFVSNNLESWDEEKIFFSKKYRAEIEDGLVLENLEFLKKHYLNISKLDVNDLRFLKIGNMKELDKSKIDIYIDYIENKDLKMTRIETIEDFEDYDKKLRSIADEKVNRANENTDIEFLKKQIIYAYSKPRSSKNSNLFNDYLKSVKSIKNNNEKLTIQSEIIQKFNNVQDITELKALYLQFKEILNDSNIQDKLKEVLLDWKKLVNEDISKQLMSNSNKLVQCKNQVLENGTKVIYLEGQEFDLLVHNANAYVGANRASEILVDDWEFEEEFSDKQEYGRRRDILCTSYINSEFFGHAKGNKEFEVIFGYDNIHSSNIKAMGIGDMQTDMSINNTEIDTNSKQCLYTANELISKTNDEYNEVVIDNKKPDYIVAFDEINDKSKQVAKELNLPIVFIDSKIYLQKQFENLNNTYDEFQKEKNIENLKKFCESTMYFINGNTWDRKHNYSKLVQRMENTLIEYGDNMKNMEDLDFMNFNNIVRNVSCWKLYDDKKVLNRVTYEKSSEFRKLENDIQIIMHNGRNDMEL